MDSEDEDWRDATVLGSEYEAQVNRRGEWRHRSLSTQRMLSLGSPEARRAARLIMAVSDGLDDEWRAGRPPDER
jgi:hypothetical protein